VSTHKITSDGGVTAGMNVSSLNVTGLDSRVGFHAGVKAELGLPQFTKVFIWIS